MWQRGLPTSLFSCLSTNRRKRHLNRKGQEDNSLLREDKAPRSGKNPWSIDFFSLIIAAKSATTEKSHIVIWKIKIYMKWNYIIGKRSRDFKTTASK